MYKNAKTLQIISLQGFRVFIQFLVAPTGIEPISKV